MAEENPNPAPDPKPEPAPAPAPDPAPEGKTFTEDQVTKLIQDRLARERGKYEGFDELKKKATEFDKLQESQQTELEKAQARADKAEAESAKAVAMANERLTAAEILAQATAQGAIKPEHMHRLIDTEQVTVGDDGQVTGALEAVSAFLAANPEYVGGKARPGAADQGARGGSGSDQVSKAELDSMSAAEINKALKEGRLNDLL